MIVKVRIIIFFPFPSNHSSPVCQRGCAQCEDDTGICNVCKNLYSLNENDETKCDPMPALTDNGTPCPDGSYNAGGQCALCSLSCATCNGPLSTNCIVCASGQSLFKDSCVKVGTNGVCAGTGGMFADNMKEQCDGEITFYSLNSRGSKLINVQACGAKCTSCEFPNFSIASIASERQCTGCLPGSFLSNGSCVGSCPPGTFISPKDNLTCTGTLPVASTFNVELTYT